VIVLRGTMVGMAENGARLPGVQATLRVASSKPEKVPATLARAENDEYQLSINLEGQQLPEGGTAHLHLVFDSGFVPRSLDITDEEHQLVIPTPYSLSLQRPTTTLPTNDNFPDRIQITGCSDTWILRDGCSLTGPTDLLRQRPVIVMRGITALMAERGGKLPGVQATLKVPGFQPKMIPAMLVLTENGEYQLTVHVEGQELPEGRLAVVDLTFDSCVVLKSLGINEDRRELAIPTPHTLSLQPVQKSHE
jgi:hypothetical protein